LSWRFARQSSAQLRQLGDVGRDASRLIRNVRSRLLPIRLRGWRRVVRSRWRRRAIARLAALLRQRREILLTRLQGGGVLGGSALPVHSEPNRPNNYTGEASADVLGCFPTLLGQRSRAHWLCWSALVQRTPLGRQGNADAVAKASYRPTGNQARQKSLNRSWLNSV
jgi:hypothetical protein